ncbi:MAG TPA: DUF2382 domain-containing protein [Thermomicrobiaceae bacterium]|nr:DUF2382 domain-containing protein [Thermomicrobiaceae bacterium]
MDNQGDARLPLEAWVDESPDGWTVRLPLRADAITVRKETVVWERVDVRRLLAARTEHLRATVKREVARVHTAGDVVEASPPAAPTATVRPRRQRKPRS